MTTRTVLIAVDGSERSEEALNWYIEHLHKPENDLVLAHAPPEPSAALTFSGYYAGVSGPIPADAWKSVVEEHKKKVDELRTKYQDLVAGKVEKARFVAHYRQGSAGAEIIKMLEDEKADMVVMGSRGMGTIRRTVLGSVSDYVIHHANVPVIIYTKHH